MSSAEERCPTRHTSPNRSKIADLSERILPSDRAPSVADARNTLRRDSIDFNLWDETTSPDGYTPDETDSSQAPCCVNRNSPNIGRMLNAL